MRKTELYKKVLSGKGIAGPRGWGADYYKLLKMAKHGLVQRVVKINWENNLTTKKPGRFPIMKYPIIERFIPTNKLYQLLK